MKAKSKKQTDLINLIDNMGEDIDEILDNELSDKYFEGIVLAYTFIENILKYVIFLKLAWDQIQIDVEKGIPPQDNFNRIMEKCRELSFYQAHKKALELNLIDEKLESKIFQIRNERNDLLHQFWLYRHRKNSKLLKRNLTRLIQPARKILKIFEKMVMTIGVEEVFDTFFFKEK